MPKKEKVFEEEADNFESFEKEVIVETPAEKFSYSIKEPKKLKREYTILSIKKGFIYMSYSINDIEYGKFILFEDKYKDLKLGDKITL